MVYSSVAARGGVMNERIWNNEFAESNAKIRIIRRTPLATAAWSDLG
jgi:hypothetical protein